MRLNFLSVDKDIEYFSVEGLPMWYLANAYYSKLDLVQYGYNLVAF